MRRLFLIAIALLFPCMLSAQYVPVSELKTQDAGGPLHGNADHALNPSSDFAAQSEASPDSATFKAINAIPQADQYSGSDMCAKMRAAALDAISKGIPQIDATHFSGTQACASDPLGGLVTTTPVNGHAPSANLTIRLGSVHIQTSVPWTITNSNLKLVGMDANVTQLEYTGSSKPAVLTIASSSPSTVGINGVRLSDMFIYGGSANITDAAVLIKAVHHSEFSNLNLWGSSSCGLHTMFAVTDTFQRIHVSINDAATNGLDSPSLHATPIHGLCLDELASGLQTTAGTVIDPIVENVTGAGIWLKSAVTMVFMAGTSENNTTSGGAPGGIQVDSPSWFNSFYGIDMEGNTAPDVLDNGRSTIYYNVIANEGITVGASAQWTDIQGGQVLSVSGSPSVWRRFGNTYETPIIINGGVKSGRTVNGVGYQLVTGPGCSIKVRSPATTGSCVTSSIPFPVDEKDGAANVVCTLAGAGGNTVVGPLVGINHEGFAIKLIAVDSTGTGGGTLTCHVGHN